MKKLSRLLLPVALVALGFALVGCPVPGTLEPPTGLALSPTGDSTSVKLTWDDQIGIDGFYVYFNGAKIATVADHEYAHMTPGATGDYHVTAYKGTDESGASSTVSDAPVINDNVQVFELNASGNSGIKFSRLTGQTSTATMGADADITGIDIYFTNFATGYTATPYQIASPSLATMADDPGMTWTLTGTPSVTGYTLPLSTGFDATVTLPPSGYLSYQEAINGSTYAIYFNDGYFGMIEVKNYTPATGTVDVRTAFQLVKGLRLLAH